MSVIMQAFVLGRFGHSYYYDYHTVKISIYTTGKWLYYKSQGWHYYMADICYAVNALILIFFQVYPKNDYLFKACFLFSNGCLAVAVGAFRNQMVFHKLDNMSSLMLHIFPQTAMWNLRWNTMPYEATLPEDQRRFLSIDTAFDVKKFFVFPLFLYFIWATCYVLINFVIARKRIKERNYDNMFSYYLSMPTTKKIIYCCGRNYVLVVFMGVHFSFFLFCHCCAMLVFYSYWFHTLCLNFWLCWSIWNAACFYMDYFAKKYDASLAKLEAVEEKLLADVSAKKND